MIEIKQDRCTIQIYDYATLSDLTISKIKKLLKMAATHSNDFEKIRVQMLEVLEREEQETRKKYESRSVYGKRDHAYFGNKLKKIEKYKGVVKSWDI